jgi:hypothetical protein
LVKTRKLEPLVSKSIMAEIAVVLQYPKIKKRHHLVSEAVDEFIDDCTQFATVTQERIRVEVVKNAPADDKYLACAAEGKADFIISGDHHLTDIETFRGIRIVDPAEFLRIVKEGDK